MNNKFIYNLYTKFFHNRVEKLLAEIIIKINYKKKNKILIIDIGAFRGEFSKKLYFFLAKKLFLNLHFFLVDPNPNFKKFISYQKFFFKYNCDNVAISNKKKLLNKLLPFYINNKFEGSGSSLNYLFAKNKYYNLSRKIFFLSFKPLFRLIKVSSLTLNQFFKKNKIKKFTILKIDAEGSELDILKSGTNYLKYGKVIYIEISALKKNYNIKYNKISNLLYKEGYIIYKSIKIIEGSILTNLKLCDCIFVKKKYLKLLDNSC
jgi:FkbM family methyltransferase